MAVAAGALAGRSGNRRADWQTGLRGAASLAVVLLVWELGVRLSGISALLLPTPSAIGGALLADFRSGRMLQHLRTSGLEFAAGYALAAVVGVPFGLLLGSYRRLEWAFSPYLLGMYSTPSQVWLPLLIMWMGIGLAPKIVLIFIFCFFAISLNTIYGVRTVDPVLMKVGRSFRASRRETFAKIIFPACLPFIVTGLRLAVGRGMIGVVLGELFGASEGVGWYIMRAGTQLQSDRVLGGVLLLVLASIALTEGVRLVERRLTPWRQEVSL